MDDGGADTTARAGDDTGGVVAPAARNDPPRLGRYRVGDRLGAGGMGVVYLAYDPVLDRQVAIKVLRKSRERSQLEREAQAIARIHHPNVVVVHDVLTDGADVCVVMQYVRGTTLAEWLSATPRPPREILARFVAAGRGLAAAHAAGLVHRDFKPENVLLGEDGAVVVTDFGLARLDATSHEDIEESEDEVQLAQTRSGSLSGTPRYMSPEQFRGELIEARSDQYNFAVALWLALFKTHPIIPVGAASNLEQHRTLVMKGAIIAPRDPRLVGARVTAALRRALSVDPGQRFATMSEFLDELSPRRRGRVIALAGVGAAAVGVGLVLATASSDKRPSAGSPAARCAQVGAPIAATWNPDARARYLARASEPTQVRPSALRSDIPELGGLMADDVAHFDAFADAWTAVAAADCRAPDPRRAACLIDLRDQLASALTRPSLRGQPVLADPRWCEQGGLHLADRVLRTSAGASAFSPDGEQIALVAKGGAYAVVGLDGSPRTGDGFALLRQWKESDAFSDKGLASHARDRRARVSPDTLEIVDTDDKVLARISIPGLEHLHGWSPDDRRIIVDTRFDIAVVDLAHARVSAIARLDHHAIGVASAQWRTASELVIAGGVKHGLGDGLWRVRLDDDGAVRDVMSLVAPVRNRALTVEDVSGDRALVERTTLSFATLRVEGGHGVPVAAPVEGSLAGADAVAGRFVINAQDGAAHLVDADGRLLGTERDGWITVRGGALLKSEARVACSALASSTCVTVVTRDGKTFLQGAGAPVPFDQPSYFTGLAVSPDGRRAVVVGNTSWFAVHDLTTGARETVTVAGCTVQKAIFDARGAGFIMAGICEDGGFQLRAVDHQGKTTVLYNSADWISGVDLWKDGSLLITTRGFASELVLLDGLPPAT